MKCYIAVSNDKQIHIIFFRFITHSTIPACIILLSLGTISAYTFHLIGRLIQICNAESSSGEEERVTSLGQLWDREIGESTSYLITLVCFLVCYGTCLAYSIILGDTFGSLVDSADVTVSNKFDRMEVV